MNAAMNVLTWGKKNSSLKVQFKYDGWYSSASRRSKNTEVAMVYVRKIAILLQIGFETPFRNVQAQMVIWVYYWACKFQPRFESIPLDLGHPSANQMRRVNRMVSARTTYI